MPVAISCTSCGHDWKLADRYGGKRVKCPGCDTIVRVPKPMDEEMDEDEDQETDDRSSRKSQRPLAFSVSFPNPDRQNAAVAGMLFGLIGAVIYSLFKRNPDSKRSVNFSQYSSATITRKGLRLRTSGFFSSQSYLIPRGSYAKHLGGNKVKLGVSGGKVEMWVTGFRFYRKRLARDLAGFLTNEKELEAEDYQIPSLLIVPLFLPFVLPLAALYLAMPTEIKPGMERALLAMGGAVIVATLLAGLLSVVCQMIVQNYKWPVGVRTLACLGLLAISAPVVPVLCYLAHRLSLAA
jgi:hypothetical protein